MDFIGSIIAGFIGLIVWILLVVFIVANPGWLLVGIGVLTMLGVGGKKIVDKMIENERRDYY